MLTRIVTCYRQWDHINRWMSLPQLHDAAIQWIIVNDAPDDACPDELKIKLESMGIHILTPKFNMGRSRARNWGVEATNSLWIEHIDGDDIPLPISLEFLKHSMKSDVVVYPVVDVSDSDMHFAEAYAHQTLEIKNNWSSILPNLCPFDVRPAGTVWKRRIFQDLGGYDARFESAEDFHLAIRASMATVTVARSKHPKQMYRLKKQNHNWDRLHIEGHLRLWEWLQSQNVYPGSQDIEMWLGKEALHNLVIAHKQFFKRRKGIFMFLRRKQ